MKSYTTDIESSKEFINSFEYDKERNLLIIKYASGDILPANCTRENMIKILKKMKNQVKNSVEFEEKIKMRFNLALFMTSLAILMLILMIFIPGMPFLLLITSLATLSIGTNSIIKNNVILTDLKKNQLLVQNSKEINSAINSLTSSKLSTIIENIGLEEVTFKDSKSLYMGIEDIPPVNVNSIDNISLENVKSLIKTLKIEPKKQERGNRL